MPTLLLEKCDAFLRIEQLELVQLVTSGQPRSPNIGDKFLKIAGPATDQTMRAAKLAYSCSFATGMNTLVESTPRRLKGT